ncbi:MAG: tetratricopeptide repeat protein, partial [Planctomycetaceae bacterium]|nr:tetratricopeptide repeat protein [Planctomycetaceae bacterium]
DTNRPDEAEPLQRRALDITETSLGPDHPSVGIRLNNLAELLRQTNRLHEAEPLYRRALQIFCMFTRQTGHRHPRLQRSIRNYRGLLQKLNVPPEEIRTRLIEAGVDPVWLSDGEVTS